MGTATAAAAFGGMLFLVLIRCPAAWVFCGLSLVVLFVVCFRYPFAGVLLLVVSMLFSPEWRLGGGVIVRGEDGVLPVFGAALSARLLARGEGFALRRSPLDWPLLGVVAAHGMASLCGGLAGSVRWVHSLLWNLKFIELFLIYWTTYQYARDPTQIRQIVRVVLGVFAAIAAYACVQIPGTEVNTLRRLTAPFEGQPEPTTLGGYLTLLVGLVLAMAIHERDRVRRLAWWALAGLAFVPILFTLSRTTYVAAVVMLVALGAVTRHAMLLLSTGLALSLSPFLLPAKVLSRIAASFDATRAMGLDPSFVERITVWKKAGHALRLNPVLGFGLPQGIVDSQFARTLIETGLAGLAAWWVLLAACFLIGRRVRRRATDPAHRALAAGHMVGVVVLFVHALASVTFYIVRIMGPFFVLTALVASLDAYYRRARLPCAASADS